MSSKKPTTIFIGTSDFAVPTLESIAHCSLLTVSCVITSPDKPTGRKQIITPPPVKLAAKKFNLPIFQPQEISNLKSQISKLKPDLIVVAAYGRLLPKEILEIPKYGCLNIHPSLLPKYRGPSPIQYAILNGDEETGVTVMLMDEKIDHGKIISNIKYQISKLTYKELEKNLAGLGAKLLIETIPLWISGKIKPKPQNELGATYTKILTKEDGKIDWQKSAEEIERQIRAFNPEPGIFTILENKIIKILKADTLLTDGNKKVGEVFLTDNKELTVACGENALILEEIQPEGKRKMTGQEFLLGHRNILGKIILS